jgi:hypothetical protein
MFGEKRRLREMVSRLSDDVDTQRTLKNRLILEGLGYQQKLVERDRKIADLEVRLAAAEATLAKVRTAMADVPLTEVQP